MNRLLIAGAGGHGKVVADAAFETGLWESIAFIDDRYPELSSVCRWPVLGRLDQASEFRQDFSHIIVAIGDNSLRVELIYRFQSMGYIIPIIVHPAAYVSKFASLDMGTVVFAKSVVNIGVKVGLGGIINTAATVDHDCELGNGIHVSPGTNIAGNVKVGEFTWLGIGSSIIQGINIGNNVTVGAGAVIINDISDNLTVVGVPGKPLSKY